MGKERLMNEAESLDFIRANTNIPVPVVHCQFEDDEAYYLITEYVEGERAWPILTTLRKPSSLKS